MNRPEGGPAVLVGLDDDPDPDQVVEVVEFLAPHHHLLVDAPEVLWPAGHLGGDARRREAFAHRHEHPSEELVPLRCATGHHLLDLRVALGMERGEREVLELPLDLLDPEPMSQRGVDVEGLLGGAPLFPLGHDREGPHVVQSVGEFDDQHPPVVGHGDEHLADGRGLLSFLGVELEPVELGDALDDQSDRCPEVTLDDLSRDAGVLYRVVQQCGRHRLGVEPQVGDDAGHCDRVGDVRLPRAPELAFVCHRGRLGGAHDDRCVLRRVTAKEGVEDGQEQGRFGSG